MPLDAGSTGQGERQRTDLALSGYVSAIRHRWKRVALCLATGVLLAAAVLVLLPTPWASTAKVLVLAPPPDPVAETSRPEEEVNMDTEAQILQSGVVHRVVAEELGGDFTVDELASGLSVTVPANTQVLRITYTHGEAETAREIANLYSRAYLGYKNRIAERVRDRRVESMTTEAEEVNKQVRRANESLADASPGSTTERLQTTRVNTLGDQLTALRSDIAQLEAMRPTSGTVIQPATPPETEKKRLALLGGGILLMSIAAGLGLAVLAEQRDPRLLSADEIRDHFQMPLLTVMGDRPGGTGKVGSPTGRDLLRYLRVRDILLSDAGPGRRVIAVLSLAGPRTGPVFGTNIARVISAAGRTVTIVDADSEVRALTQLVNLSEQPEPGITLVLLSDLGNSQLLPLLQHADSAVLVARPRVTDRHDLAEAAELVDLTGTRLLGAVVVNETPDTLPTTGRSPKPVETAASAR